MLSHEPIALDMQATRGVSLILSGHTHGGQICLPLVGTPISHLWPKYFRYVRGMHESEGTRLYVSRGTGMIGVPVRLGARPEVAEAFGDERAGQKRVVLAEEASESLGCVLLAAVVARLGEAVGEEEERVARLHSETLGGELLVAENSDGQPRCVYERRVAAAQK